MRLDELDYDLPDELIAQVPAEPRDASRLLVAAGAGAFLRLGDKCFRDLPALLAPGDVLVRNDTRVIPARARFRKPTGGRIELLFVERLRDGVSGAGPAATPDTWEVLARGRLHGGELLRSEAAPDAFAVEVADAPRRRTLSRAPGGRRRRTALAPAGALRRDAAAALHQDAARRSRALSDRLRTAAWLGRGADRRACTSRRRSTRRCSRPASTIEHLTLHVGLATFKPVTAARVEDHPLHEEPYVVDRPSGNGSRRRARPVVVSSRWARPWCACSRSSAARAARGSGRDAPLPSPSGGASRARASSTVVPGC